MAQLTREKITAFLQPVAGSQARVSGVVVRGEHIGFSLEVAEPSAEMERLRQECEAAVRTLPGVGKVTAVLTAHRHSVPRGQSGTHLPPEQRKPARWSRDPLEGVKRVIAIASGKGGVGKSTTTANLARALHGLGWRVGVLDADIYGPSMPRMLHMPGRAEVQDGKLLPLEAGGMRCLSIAHLADGEGPLAWRGSMATKALQQMTRQTRWATKDKPLDLLLVDMPPGTGDIHLSLAQGVPLSGAVIVTTPQEVALMDARKSLEMFRKMEVPVLGVVENMSGPVFGSGGGKMMAEQYSVPFLGAVALDGVIREGGDAGCALSLETPAAQTYRAMAETLQKVF